jgi:HlyD family secretion protein
MPREDHNRRKVEHQRQQELLKSEQLALAELEANYALSKDTAQAELAQARAAMEQALAAISVQSLERKLALADVRVRQSLIRAPLAGQVLKVHTHAGERIGNDPILKLGNVAEMHAVAEVYETDVSRVRVGQSALVSSPSLERPLEGTVVQVGLMIHKNDVLSVDPAADADARVVEVRVKLNEPERAAGLTYLQVDVLINVGEGAGT